MACFDFKCTNCGFTDEYFEGFSVNKELMHPEICPKCNNGKMVKQFSVQGQSFDVVGGSSYHKGGKKDWKHNNSPNEQAKILTGERDPY
jgi:putative FmdB family regulatory protein